MRKEHCTHDQLLEELIRLWMADSRQEFQRFYDEVAVSSPTVRESFLEIVGDLSHELLPELKQLVVAQSDTQKLIAQLRSILQK